MHPIRHISYQAEERGLLVRATKAGSQSAHWGQPLWTKRRAFRGQSCSKTRNPSGTERLNLKSQTISKPPIHARTSASPSPSLVSFHSYLCPFSSRSELLAPLAKSNEPSGAIFPRPLQESAP